MDFLKKLVENSDVTEVHPSVQKWVEEGSPKSGPFTWPEPPDFIEKPYSCRHFIPNAPEAPFPGLYLCHVQNANIWVLVETGEVISLPHDYLVEIAFKAAKITQSPRGFANFLASEGSVFNFDSFFSLAKSTADWPSLWPPGLTSHERVRFIAKGLQWSMDKLFSTFRKNSLPLAFLRLDEDMLADLAVAEQKMAKMEEKPDAKKIDLSWCWLSRWPEALDNSRVEVLNLSGNPDLPWDTIHEKLGHLPKLKTLIAAGNHLGTASELKAALPGVRIDTRPSYKNKVLENLARAPLGVKYLDLEGAELKSLPAEVTGFTDLEVINLSQNRKLDWEQACTHLAELKNLKEVIFKDCELRELPKGLQKLTGLERLNLRYIRNQNADAQIEFLKAFPRLREINLGRFPCFFGGSHTEDIKLPVFPHLESITIDAYIYIPALVKWMKQLPQLRTLRIDIASADITPVKELENLRELHVSGLKAEALPAVLKSLPRLEALTFPWHRIYNQEIHKDKIVPFPGEIRALKSLKYLSTHWVSSMESNHSFGYKSGELPDWLSELPLETFIYETHRKDGGGLKEIPPVVYRLTGLKKLVLDMWAAKVSISPDIAQLNSLEEFVFKGWYSQFPPGVRLPKTLKKLEVQEVPENLGELKLLRNLDVDFAIDENQAKELGQLTELETLRVWLPEGVMLPASLTKLKKLCCNGLIPDLPSLLELEARRDTDLPANLPELRKLVWHPSGESWPDQFQKIAKYPRLRELSISFNWEQEPKLSMFKGFNHLEYLWVGNTRFDPSFIKGLKQNLPNCKIIVS